MRRFNRRLFRGALCASIVGLIALSPLAARAGTIVSDAGDWDYLHQQLGNSNKYKPVGMFTTVSTDNKLYLGSGTVIGNPQIGYGVGSQWVLTAAHVVNGMKEIAFDVDGYRYYGDRWYVPTEWDGNYLTGGHDIALVHLISPTIVHPAKPYTGGNILGEEVTIVGFGTTGTGMTGSILEGGTKRAGKNIVDRYVPLAGNQEAEYDFDAPESEQLTGLNLMGGMFPIGLEYSAAPGDSGGPVYLGDQIIGVTSWGTIGAFFGTEDGFTAVAPRLDWIEDVMGGVLTGSDEGTPLAPLPDLTKGSTTNDPMSGSIDGKPLTYNTFIPLAQLGYDSVSDVPIYQPLPEPATLGLLSLGGLALLKRRRGGVKGS